MINDKYSIATLAGGCFWCTEAVFKRLKGVSSVRSGYSGGEIPSPDNETVSLGNSGHAEAIQIEFNPDQISFADLLSVFWKVHDPTTKNRQGQDIGSQYRSVIFYHNDHQKQEALNSIKTLEDSGKFTDEIVTEIVPYKNFYPAEEYHQNFYDSNPEYPYCKIIIEPKIQKLLKNFGDKLKK